MHIVRVNRKAADRVASGHPWIFSSDILDRGDAAAGDAVEVVDGRGRRLGIAHYSSSSQVTLRMLGSTVETVDRAFYLKRLAAALDFRRKAVAATDAYRLIHGEADLLPALVVDRYGEYLAVQTLSQGMDRAKPDILSCLEELCRPAATVFRNDVAVRKREELPLESGVAAGHLDGPVQVQMNGLTWQVDLLHGQKTGIYLDQRENYVAARSHARGGAALDCFTSSGGFALHLASACERVEAVDSSELALSSAAKNAETNRITNVDLRQADVFDLLATYAQSRRRFDLIVLDPPAFAKSRAALEGATRGYKEINQRALRLLNPGGVLVTCSCSQHFSESMLLETIAQAALDANKQLRVLERRTQASDHPILLTVPETHYLKCIIVQVLSL